MFLLPQYYLLGLQQAATLLIVGLIPLSQN
nr:MAG TPA: hypothetical protein [Bacteriophage sp.]